MMNLQKIENWCFSGLIDSTYYGSKLHLQKIKKKFFAIKNEDKKPSLTFIKNN